MIDYLSVDLAVLVWVQIFLTDSHIIVSDVVGGSSIGLFLIELHCWTSFSATSSQLSAASLAHFCLASAHLHPHAPQASAISLEDPTLKVVSLFLSHNLINLMISQKVRNGIM